MTDFVRLDIEAFREHDCELKHWLVERELAVEYIARVARQIIEDEDPKDLMLKMDAIVAYLIDVENRIDMFAEEILFVKDKKPRATYIRVDREEFKRWLMQLGHAASAEEHSADHIKAYYKRMKKANNKEDKIKWREKMNIMIKFGDATRLSRQNYINDFLREELKTGDDKEKAKEGEG